MVFHVPFPQTMYTVVHNLPLKQDEEMISEILAGYRHQCKYTFRVRTIYGKFQNSTKSNDTETITHSIPFTVWNVLAVETTASMVLNCDHMK
jgi:hypothetical protein